VRVIAFPSVHWAQWVLARGYLAFELQFEKANRRYVTRGVRDILLTPGLLDTEKPDIVILQTLERCWTL
jgi:hypothetical protein